MREFKPGDRVVRIYGTVYKPGTKATIISKSEESDSDYLVKMDDSDEEDIYWYGQYIELEEILESPLYKAMEEKDE